MSSGAERAPARFHLDRAVGLVHHDRWLLGAVQEGRLRVLADSRPEPDRPFRRTRPLSHLARRCLQERRPLAVSALVEADPGAADPGLGDPDWELDWPALLYAPVGMPRRRPVGLLVLGSRSQHWYSQEEIDYVGALGVTLTSLVLSLGGPLARLRGRERHTAQLVGQGLSAAEIAAALGVDRPGAQELVAQVLRKLALRSPQQLADAWPELEPSGG
jgi:DNA-binding CsgD family transcriptional regulator